MRFLITAVLLCIALLMGGCDTSEYHNLLRTPPTELSLNRMMVQVYHVIPEGYEPSEAWLANYHSVRGIHYHGDVNPAPAELWEGIVDWMPNYTTSVRERPGASWFW